MRRVRGGGTSRPPARLLDKIPRMVHYRPRFIARLDRISLNIKALKGIFMFSLDGKTALVTGATGVTKVRQAQQRGASACVQ